MANTPTAKQRKPTPTTDDQQEASITNLKKGTCKNLNGTATIGYHVGLEDTSAL
jgi:hypothetical protein